MSSPLCRQQRKGFMVRLLERFREVGGVDLGVRKGHSAYHLSESAWAGSKGMKKPPKGSVMLPL